MVFLFISCQIFPKTITVIIENLLCAWVCIQHSNIQGFFFFFLLRRFCLNTGGKNGEKKIISHVVKEPASEICLYFAIYSKYFWNSCRCSNESSSVETGCGNIHSWRLCISPALWPTEKEIVVHSIKYCQYD